MQTPEIAVHYALHVEASDGRVAFSQNAQEVFETASAIKSPIGSLAIMKALDAGIDIDTYTVLVGPQHYSNGSGSIKHEMVKPGERPKDAKSKTHRLFTLADILAMNLIDSDCVATNVLIDYLDGKDVINAQLQNAFNLPDMAVMTDQILFTGVDHTAVPFQVGKSTMADFTSYYRQVLWSDFTGVTTHQAWKQHFDMHAKVKTAHLLAEDVLHPHTELVWLNKTGTIVDDRPNVPVYVNYADAGILYFGRTVMAAATAFKLTTQQPQALSDAELMLLEDDFLTENANNLESAGVSIPESGLLCECANHS